MTTTQTAFKTTRRSKYADFEEKWMRVPVQYGNLSKHERRCYHLALIGSVPSQGEIYNYYRICDDQPGARRFWMTHRFVWKDKHYDWAYYISYSRLPQQVRDAVEGNGQMVWTKLKNEEILSDAHKARLAKDEDFFMMPPEQLLDYLNAYQRREPKANEWDEGNALNDVIFRYSWDCVDFDSTKAAAAEVTNDRTLPIVILKEGGRLIRAFGKWSMEAKR